MTKSLGRRVALATSLALAAAVGVGRDGGKAAGEFNPVLAEIRLAPR